MIVLAGSPAACALCPAGIGVGAVNVACAEDLSYLLDLDPDEVSDQDLYDRAVMLEANYQAYHCVNGIIWEAWYADGSDAQPSYYGTGGDSAIFSGFYLAGAVYRFLTTRSPGDLAAVYEAARGLHILTHVSGIPGVIARCAFPTAQASQWHYPEAWQDRIASGYVYKSPCDIPDIGNPSTYYPQMIYYTRATRDQLTGILYGIGVALAELDPHDYSVETAGTVQKIRDILHEVIRALWGRLETTGFMIKDHTGATGSSAIMVSGLLKAQVLAVYRASLAQRLGAFQKDDLVDVDFQGEEPNVMRMGMTYFVTAMRPYEPPELGTVVKIQEKTETTPAIVTLTVKGKDKPSTYYYEDLAKLEPGQQIWFRPLTNDGKDYLKFIWWKNE